MNYQDTKFISQRADPSRLQSEDHQYDCGFFDGIISSNSAPGFNRNILLYSDDAFFHAADKVVRMKDQSGLSSNHILYQTLTAKERMLFAEAFQHRFRTLTTFPVPGEKPEEEILRRVNNLFGSTLLSVQTDDSLNIADQENVPGRSNLSREQNGMYDVSAEPSNAYIKSSSNQQYSHGFSNSGIGQQQHQARNQPPSYESQSNFPYHEMGTREIDGTARHHQYEPPTEEAAYQKRTQQNQQYQPPPSQHHYTDPRMVPNVAGGPRLPQYQHRQEEWQDSVRRGNHGYDESIEQSESPHGREQFSGRFQNNVGLSPRSPRTRKNEKRQKKTGYLGDKLHSRKNNRSSERYDGHSRRRYDRSLSSSPERDDRKTSEKYRKSDSQGNQSRSPDQKISRSKDNQNHKSVNNSSPRRGSNKRDKKNLRREPSPSNSEASVQQKLAPHESIFLTKAQSVQHESRIRQSLMAEIDHAREMVRITKDPVQKETFWKHLKILQLELLKLSSETSLELPLSRDECDFDSSSTSKSQTRTGNSNATSPIHEIISTPADDVLGPRDNRGMSSGVENRSFVAQSKESRGITRNIDHTQNTPVLPVTMDRSIDGSMRSDQRSVPTIHSEQTHRVGSTQAMKDQSEKNIASQLDQSHLNTNKSVAGSMYSAQRSTPAVNIEQNLRVGSFQETSHAHTNVVSNYDQSHEKLRQNSQPPTNTQIMFSQHDSTATRSRHPGERLVSVVAPNTLPEGYRFEAKVGNEVFLATVPKGGVVKGQVFQSTMTDIFSRNFAEMKIPEGRWRDSIFDCLKFGIFHPFAVISCFCPQIALSQIMARMRLTSDGRSAASLNSRIRVKSVLGLTIGFISLNALLVYVLVLSPQIAQIEIGMFCLGLILLQTPILYCFYHMLIKTRRAVRRTYKIQEEGFEGFEDMIVSIWCTCCALTQMGRHTADYNTYRALWCTDTGLPDHLEVNLPADSPQVHLPSIV